jgi:hypothetical protein
MKVILGKRRINGKIVVLEYDEAGGYLPLAVYDTPDKNTDTDTISLLITRLGDNAFPIHIDENVERNNIQFPADITTAVELFKTRE